MGEPDFHIELRPLASGSSGGASELNSSLSSSSSSYDVSTELQPSTDKAGVQSYYKLICGPDLEVTGPCTGRKDGQQLAAQAMLKVISNIIQQQSNLDFFVVTSSSHPYMGWIIKALCRHSF